MPRKIIKFAAITAVGIILLYARPIQAEAPEKPDNSATSYETGVELQTNRITKLYNGLVSFGSIRATPNIYYKPSPTDPLDIWIEKLVLKESGGNERIEIIDVNGKYSRGCLQFQDETFINYSKLYFGQSNYGRILDCGYQKELARKMLEDNYGHWKHWYHSVITRGLGLPPSSTNPST